MFSGQALVDGLGEVMFQFPFRVPAYYALILRSLTVLEGLALQADPNYKLLGKCYPYIAKRLLTDPAPELRFALPLLSHLPTFFRRYFRPFFVLFCVVSGAGALRFADCLPMMFSLSPLDT